MEYIQVRNWSEYQHYSQRNPPWIKLHNKLLDNYDYGCLQDASKLLLISLYLLASRTDNRIPADHEWIKSKAMLKGKIDLQPLIKASFITVVADCKHDASEVLATCKQNGGTETETETETEKSRDREDILSGLGEFQNVKMTKKEYGKLKERFGDEGALKRIENLSQYMASKKKKYDSHYATILNWENRDGGSNGKSSRVPKPDGFAEKQYTGSDLSTIPWNKDSELP